MKNTYLVAWTAFIAWLLVMWWTYAFPGWFGGEYKEEVQTAVETNDYGSLPTEVQEKISEEKFALMVEKREDWEEHQAELEEVVSANDFEAFVALHEEHRAEMEANRPEWAPEREMPEISEEMLQEKFDSLVDYYTENGELPQGRGGFGMKGGKWGCGWHGKEMRGSEGEWFGLQGGQLEEIAQ